MGSDGDCSPLIISSNDHPLTDCVLGWCSLGYLEHCLGPVGVGSAATGGTANVHHITMRADAQRRAWTSFVW